MGHFINFNIILTPYDVLFQSEIRQTNESHKRFLIVCVI